MATREAYGRALVEIARDHPDVVVVDADLGKSTFSTLFAQAYPERYYELGVAEQNMMSVAAGLATCGKIPFATTFAVFATGRAFDQVRVGIAQPKLNVKIVASHAGLTVGEDGKSAQAVEDLALMCALPGFTVVVPADAQETALAVAAAVATPGPFYIRTSRPPIPLVTEPGYCFTVGKAATLREGDDATIIANGVMVQAALVAADLLADQGVECRVLNMATLKPLDRKAIIRAAVQTGAVVTAEEHLQHGGLSSLVAQVLSVHRPTPLGIVAIQDRYGQSGKPAELLRLYGLTAADIVRKVRRVLRQKARSLHRNGVASPQHLGVTV
ncbi:MAG: transketolase family protein [Chloroflexi bacterium]|nr:transketolase family protein [Chloroflexota bacterium]